MRLPVAIERSRHLQPEMSLTVDEFRALFCPKCGASLRSYSAHTGDFRCERGHGTYKTAAKARLAAGGVGEVSVLGPISEVSGTQLRRRLASLRAAGARAVLVTLDSEGGDLFASWQMHDALRACGVPVVAYVAGRAQSAATVVMLSADHVVLRPLGWLMVHRPTSDDETARRAEQARMVDLYARRTAEGRRTLWSYMDGKGNVFLNSVTALARGWCDSVGDFARALAVAKELAAGRRVTSPRSLALQQ